MSIFTVAFWGESCYNHDGQRHMWRFSFRGGHGNESSVVSKTTRGQELTLRLRSVYRFGPKS